MPCTWFPSLAVQQPSFPKLTCAVISSHQDTDKPLDLGCPSPAVLSSGRKTHAEDAQLADTFQTDRLPSYSEGSVWGITQIWYRGPKPLHCTTEQGQSRLCFLPLIYAEQTQFAQQGCLCKWSILHMNLVVWGSLRAARAEYVNYRSVKFSVYFGLL